MANEKGAGNLGVDNLPAADTQVRGQGEALLRASTLPICGRSFSLSAHLNQHVQHSFLVGIIHLPLAAFYLSSSPSPLTHVRPTTYVHVYSTSYSITFLQ